MALGAMASGGGKRRERRRAVMSEINVTPMVDVMLVLLIIFVVSAPLMTVGVSVDLPETRAKALDKDRNTFVIKVRGDKQIFLQEPELSNETEVSIDNLVQALKISAQTKGGLDMRINVRSDKSLNVDFLMQVMGRVSEAGFRRIAFVTRPEGS